MAGQFVMSFNKVLPYLIGKPQIVSQIKSATLLLAIPHTHHVKQKRSDSLDCLFHAEQPFSSVTTMLKAGQ